MLNGFTPAIIRLLENNAIDRARVVFIASLNSGDSVQLSEHNRGKINTSRCIVVAHLVQVGCKIIFFCNISEISCYKLIDLPAS